MNSIKNSVQCRPWLSGDFQVAPRMKSTATVAQPVAGLAPPWMRLYHARFSAYRDVSARRDTSWTRRMGTVCPTILAQVRKLIKKITGVMYRPHCGRKRAPLGAPRNRTRGLLITRQTCYHSLHHTLANPLLTHRDCGCTTLSRLRSSDVFVTPIPASVSKNWQRGHLVA